MQQDLLTSASSFGLDKNVVLVFLYVFTTFDSELYVEARAPSTRSEYP